MLTSELAIIEYKNGLAAPDRLTRNTHRHYPALAGQMLALYQGGIGKQRQKLHQEVERIFEAEPDCPSRRIQAFCKLLDDRSIYTKDTPQGASRLRLRVFTEAARYHPLVKEQDRLFEHKEETIKTLIAENLKIPWEQIEQDLYCDVIAFQRMEEFNSYEDPSGLLSQYNVSQLQACLYHAVEVTITATEDLKTILRYAKLAKLLHTIDRISPSKYKIILSGPASVLHETRRYGVCFARFLPAILTCRGWRMEAILQTRWKTTARLVLSDKDKFTSHLPAPEEFDSSVEESFAKRFGPCRDGWHLIREGQILFEHQTACVPDFVFRHDDGTEVALEIIGFWTPEYLEHKRQLIRRFKDTRLLIAIPGKFLKSDVQSDESFIPYKTSIPIEPVLVALKTIRKRGWPS
jgi:predicted nuclease of restriction endonuclease-like RecB superfamily